MQRWIGIAMVMAAFLMLGSARAADVVTYYYTSPQGTVLAKADSAGNLISTVDYRPYGSQALGTPEQGPGYTGHVNDVDSGLVYMRARYYDPEIGRFLSTDPASTTPGSVVAFNRYVYASNNPVLNIDPDGRQSVPGSIDWQAPGMMEAWQTTGREFTIPVLIDLVPGGGFVNCAMQGCGGGGWAMAALPIVGGEIRGASRVFSIGEKMAAVAAKGRRGEEAVRKVADIGEKIAIDINGTRRVPDGIVESVSINEVKNVARQGLTAQIRDYLQFAKDNKLQFNLYTNEESKLAKPLQDLIDAGEINHYRVPMNE
ncbi:RHS repeat-associated core domain-containing protein [Luteibacter sp. 3190]|uniref:RHS repeat-associated core domain-containing protein n=1 Tax=Luteibacter sp. 3190 TaxID=2817736 RepID=UPI00285C6EFD|nr:RHS repeat-associated core domain-containing protein [Luteibacter sp. 3190]MDR6937329.1 RHS repeat-associated protein [Luteibacter sp. 3190]